MAQIDVSRAAEIVAVMGGSGSGKSTYMKGEMRRRKPPRLLIYDPDGEYSAFGRQVTRVSDVVDVLRQCAGGKPFRLVFNPSADPARSMRQFDVICKAAFAAGDLLFLVDELADVTTPSRAPVGWSMLTRRGRKRGCIIYGAAQRPANIDKNFLGNCSRVRSGRLIYEDDARAVARVLGVQYERVMVLPPLTQLERVAGGEVTTWEGKFGAGEVARWVQVDAIWPGVGDIVKAAKRSSLK